MPAGRAFTGSIALHVGGLALFVHALDPPPVTLFAPTAMPAPVVTVDRHEPIVVSIIDELPPSSAGTAAVAAGNERSFRGGTARVSAVSGVSTGVSGVSGASGTSTSEPGASAPAPGRPGDLMTMRSPDLHPNAATLSAIAGVGELPSPVHSSGRLHNVPGGGAVIHDRVANVRVDRDGAAHIDSAPDIDIHLKLPLRPDLKQDLRDIGKSLHDWADDPYAGERYNRTMDLPKHLQAIPGQCDTYGDPMCDDPDAPEAKVMKNWLSDDGYATSVAGGKLDLTAYLARKFHVGDVYASRKLALLDSTRDERAARGGAFRAEQLARSAELMRDNLAQLAASSPAELHQALFELWDECAEGDGPTGEAGQRARAQVIAWIHAHLPEGGTGAFTAAEIAGLDGHRSSKQHFAPYAP